jgi:hypothetical protein
VTEGASDTIEGTLVETEEGLRVAEADGDPEPAASDPAPTDNSGESGDEDPEPAADETVPRVENDDEKKKTAEQLIAELAEAVKTLAEEVKSLKEQHVAASAEKLNVAAEAVNPFVDSMTAKADYYDLLQPVEKKNGRDLLSR